MTVSEAAAVLRVGRNATYELIRSGQLRHYKVGRSIRIPRDAVSEFINGISTSDEKPHLEVVGG